MLSRSTLVVTAILVAGLLSPSTAALAAPPAGTLADNAADGRIAAYGDVVAWNVRVAGNEGYHLAVWRGGTTTILPVAPSTLPFDVSAGRGPNGATWLVWTRCAGGTSPGDAAAGLRSCDVVRYDLDHPGEREVAGAATTVWNEHAPSIDGDRVAVARVRSGGKLEHIAITATGAKALAVPVPRGVPATNCRLAMLLTCEPVTSSLVRGTALRGGHLAVSTSVQVRDAIGICGMAEARMINLKTGFATALAEGVCGLGGQHYGPFGFDTTGALWLVRVCGGDPDGCRNHVGDPLGWNPATRRAQHVKVPRARGIGGLAVSGDTLITSVSTSVTTPCRVSGTIDPPSCFRVEAPSGVSPVAAPLDVSGKVPPDDYLATRGPAGRRVVAPPANLPCEASGSAPAVGAEAWAGAQVPGAAIGVTARSGARTVRGTVKAGRKGQDGWVYTRLALGGRSSCGRTWTLTYRTAGHTRTFRTAIAEG